MKKIFSTTILFLAFISCLAQQDSANFNRQGGSPRVPYLWVDKVIYLGSWGNKALSETLDTSNNFIVKKGDTASFKKNNIAIGFKALDSITSGNVNVAIGKKALTTNRAGSQNVAIGLEAMRNNTASSFNTAVGAYAMGLGKGGSSNTAVGYASLYNDSTLGNQNTAVGHYSLFSNIGGGSFMGSSNTSIGAFAMQNNKYSSANTAVGTLALRNIDNPSGGSNTAMGQGALQNARGGFSNTVIGTQAGFVANGYIQSLTLVGRDAGYDLTTGSNNVFLGFRTGLGITTGRGNTVLGVANYVFPSNLTRNVVIGCDDSTATDFTKNIYMWIDSNKNAKLYGKLSLPDTTTAMAFKTPTGTASQLLAANGSVVSAGTNITINGNVISASGGGGSTLATATGDVSGTVSGTNLPLTLATVNSNVGSYGSPTSIPIITANAKGLITGLASTSIPVLATGTYTPTLSSIANCTSATASVAQWMQLGNVVTVSGSIQLTPNNTTSVFLVYMSIPVVANFLGASSKAGGVASRSNGNTSVACIGAINADSAGSQNVIVFFSKSEAATTDTYSYTYTYRTN